MPIVKTGKVRRWGIFTKRGTLEVVTKTKAGAQHRMMNYYPPGSTIRRVTVSWCLLLAFLILSACGTPRTPGIAGPGDTRLGDTIATVEHAHPSWSLEVTKDMDDGRQVRQYRDYHWSLSAGLAHSAEHHILYFRGGKLDGWIGQ